MFRFPLSRPRGLLVVSLALVLLTTLIPTASSARNPYEMQIAKEGDPGDGVLEPSVQPDERQEVPVVSTGGYDLPQRRSSVLNLLPRVIWFGPGYPVLWLGIANDFASDVAAPPHFAPPTMNRGW